MMKRIFQTTVCLMALAALPVLANHTLEAGEVMATQDNSLQELSFTQAESEFGPVLERDEFDLAAELPEFRNELPDLFDHSAINSGARILEATWSFSATQNRTLWFRREGDGWRYVHHKVWDKGEEF